jgi:arylsulfatase A-like enzyme
VLDTHVLRQHDNTIFEEGIRVLLIIHDPRASTGRSISEPVRQTAIMPTVTISSGTDCTATAPGGRVTADGATGTRNAHPDNVRAIQVALPVVGHALEPHDQPGARKP